jgi:hypothetical protein
MTDETEDIAQDNLQHKSRNLIDLPNLDVPIFRVFSVERLIQVFDEKKITLVKPEKWDDPFENLVFQGTAIGNDGIRIHFDNIRKSFYGQCWTLNTDESDALWRIYSSDKKGVRVKSTIQKLFDTFFNPNDNWALISYFIGRVAYDTAANLKAHLENPAVLHDYIFDTSARGQVMTLLWKRTEFQHEEEVRIITEQTIHTTILLMPSINSMPIRAIYLTNYYLNRECLLQIINDMNNSFEASDSRNQFCGPSCINYQI